MLATSKGMMQVLGYGNFYAQGFRAAGGAAGDLSLDGCHVHLTVKNKTKNLTWRGTGQEINADAAAFAAAINPSVGDLFDVTFTGTTGGYPMSLQGFASGEWRPILIVSGNGAAFLIDSLATVTA